jgi:hypothetical protein
MSFDKIIILFFVQNLPFSQYLVHDSHVIPAADESDVEMFSTVIRHFIHVI